MHIKTFILASEAPCDLSVLSAGEQGHKSQAVRGISHWLPVRGLRIKRPRID